VELLDTLNKDKVIEALKTVLYPGFNRDIVSFGLVREVTVEGGSAKITLALTTSDPKVPSLLKTTVDKTVAEVEGISHVETLITVNKLKAQQTAATGAGPSMAQNKIPGVRRTVAIASGKGGVGKSTFTVNLACALDQVFRERGLRNAVGIMDCDLYGPTVPLMIGINGHPQVDGEMMIPLENFGIRVMSMGFLIDPETPVIWRGPMVAKTITQFVRNVAWGELEIIVIDLPPGTGDAQLSLAQTIALDGVVIVTTPQAAAWTVARRGAMMFEKVNVPILGVAENMSYLDDPSSGKRTYLFGRGGGEKTARALKTKLLGQVPLFEEIRQGGDNGIPVVVGSPRGQPAQIFRSIALNLLETMDG